MVAIVTPEVISTSNKRSDENDDMSGPLISSSIPVRNACAWYNVRRCFPGSSNACVAFFQGYGIGDIAVPACDLGSRSVEHQMSCRCFLCCVLLFGDGPYQTLCRKSSQPRCNATLVKL